MHAGSVARIETGLDRAAAALFALACGYAGHVWLAAQAEGPALAVEALAVAGFGYLAATVALTSVERKPRALSVPIFDVREVEPMGPLHAVEPAQDALLLDDVLAELGPDSRVVRLFDPAAMPSPGELEERIDRHIDDDAAAAQSSDAAQALHEALAELRRSLR